MKTRTKRLLFGCAFAFLLGAPFPTSARQLTITIHGSMFTREYRASFAAPPEEIEEWLRQSPGASVSLISDSTMLDDAGQSQSAVVRVVHPSFIVLQVVQRSP